MNQFKYLQTWVFIFVVIICVLTQMNYFNKAPNTFNTAVVSPIYYVMFTSLTIVASVIMFKDWDRQNPTQIITEMCGFVTILSGTFLHKTMDTTDVVVGEIANFAAYAFAPAILVTPLGALSIIISAALAHVILKEKLHIVGVLGCALCVVGSTAIVLHAPPEQQIESVTEVWDLATERGQVMGVKALVIALKLTFSWMNQFMYPQTWVSMIVVAFCVLTQMNYLNMALDTFNTAMVSPIYYVMFTSFTILASVIMFKGSDHQNPTQIVTEVWFRYHPFGYLPSAQDKGHG